MGGRREEGSAGAARPAAGLPARSPAARSPSADGGAGPFRNPTPPPTNGDENKKERSKRPRRPWRRFQRVSLGPTGGRGGALYFFGSMAGPSRSDRGRFKAVPEKAGPTSGVPPHWRSEDVARQATCRPVSGTKRSQEHFETSISRVYRR